MWTYYFFNSDNDTYSVLQMLIGNKHIKMPIAQLPQPITWRENLVVIQGNFRGVLKALFLIGYVKIPNLYRVI